MPTAVNRNYVMHHANLQRRLNEIISFIASFAEIYFKTGETVTIDIGPTINLKAWVFLINAAIVICFICVCLRVCVRAYMCVRACVRVCLCGVPVCAERVCVCRTCLKTVPTYSRVAIIYNIIIIIKMD